MIELRTFTEWLRFVEIQNNFSMFIQIPPDLKGFQEGIKKLEAYYNRKQ